jgi:hypothetical protein
MYAPTNMHGLPYLGRGRLSALSVPPCTSELLENATEFDCPPTGIEIPQSWADYEKPRIQMTLRIFLNALITEVLIKGIKRGDDGLLRLPMKGSLEEHEVKDISELFGRADKLG